MFTYKNRTELAQAHLVVGDLVQVLGITTEGDSATQYGLVRDSSYSTQAETVSLSSGNKAELFPAASATGFDDLSNAISKAGYGSTARSLSDRFSDIINVKDHGVVGDGLVDDTEALQALLTSARGCTVYFPSGTYRVTRGLVINSNTTIEGEFGQSTIFRPSDVYTGLYAKSPYNSCFFNENFHAESAYLDENIQVINMRFEYEDLTFGASGRVGVYMRRVSNVKVIRCSSYNCGDLSAFRYCRYTEVNGCIAHNTDNAPYDHWDCAENAIVTNCIAYNDPSAKGFNQGIMFTGDETTIDTNTIVPTGHSFNVVISNNILLSSNSTTDTSSGYCAPIILNCVTTDTSSTTKITRGVITGNIIMGYDDDTRPSDTSVPAYGIVLEGTVANVSICSNVISNVETGVHLKGRNTGLTGVVIQGNSLESVPRPINATVARDILVVGNSVNNAEVSSYPFISIQTDVESIQAHSNDIGNCTSIATSNSEVFSGLNFREGSLVLSKSNGAHSSLILEQSSTDEEPTTIEMKSYGGVTRGSLKMEKSSLGAGYSDLEVYLRKATQDTLSRLFTVSSEGFLRLDGHTLIISGTNPPSSSNETGTTGSIKWGSTHLYVCVADNQWKRVALETW